MRRSTRSTLFPYTTLFRCLEEAGLAFKPLLDMRDEIAALEERLGDDTHSEAQHAAMLERYAERSEEHTSELQSQSKLVCRLLLAKNKQMVAFARVAPLM